MWSNHSYDYGYLLELEREKLKDMYEYFSNANIIEDEWIRARDCKLAISLLNIILEDDSSYDVYFAEGAKIGEGRYVIRKYVNDSNIDRLLADRHMKAVLRKASKKIKNQRKRNKKDEVRFINSLEKIILQSIKDC